MMERGTTASAASASKQTQGAEEQTTFDEDVFDIIMSDDSIKVDVP